MVGVVLRWDTAQGKEIRPLARYSNGWRITAMPEPRPLYRLPAFLASDASQPVFICEGEKAAHAARRCGLLATTSAGGARAAGKTDCGPLTGQYVVILPDYDAAGEAYAQDVAQLAHKANAADVRVVRLADHAPGLPAGGDLADVLDARDWCRLPLGDAAEPEDCGRLLVPLAEQAEPWPKRSYTALWKGGVMPCEEVRPEAQLSFYPDGAPLRGALRITCGADSFIDQLNIARQQARERFADSAAAHFPRLDRQWLLHELEQIAVAQLRAAETPPEMHKPAEWQPSAEAKTRAAELLEQPNLLDVAIDAVNALGVVEERPLIGLAYLVATSRLLSKPLYLLIQGEPSGGKTLIARTVCQLLPPGMVLDATDITPSALYYLHAIGVKYKVLLLGERRRQIDDAAADATKALRELTETGKISKLLPVKRPDGSFSKDCVELEGPVAIIETASHDKIAHEDATRQIVTWTDESPEQTRRVLESYAAVKAGQVTPPDAIALDALRAIQTLLEPVEVLIPFLSELAKKFPAAKVEARRCFVRVVAVAEASALLHQRQRRGNVIIAEPADAKRALRLLAPWLDATLVGGVPPTTQRVWEAIKAQSEEFTAPAGAKELEKGRRVVNRALRQLEEAGAIEPAGEAGRGKPQPYRVANRAWQPSRLAILADEICA